MTQRLRIAIFMGGPSSEHEVSLKTGAMVAAHLDREKYQPTKVVVSRKGRWPISFQNLRKNFDILFNAMHGEYGEDGTIQQLLDGAGVPYTGSSVEASRLGMNKPGSMLFFTKKGLLVPPWRLYTKYRLLPSRLIDDISRLQLPLVIKPADRGSSVGVSIVRSLAALPKALRFARQYSSAVLLQKYIHGIELTCGVLDRRGRPTALPVTEIVPKKSTFFDYRAKYESGGSDEITPARIPRVISERVKRAALLAHRAIGASGYSRSDFILDPKNKLWILEINTLPGLTEASLLPKAARAAGISFPKLLEFIIETALKTSD